MDLHCFYKLLHKASFLFYWHPSIWLKMLQLTQCYVSLHSVPLLYGYRIIYSVYSLLTAMWAYNYCNLSDCLCFIRCIIFIGNFFAIQVSNESASLPDYHSEWLHNFHSQNRIVYCLFPNTFANIRIDLCLIQHDISIFCDSSILHFIFIQSLEGVLLQLFV